jgi:hypothetical protein
MSITWMLRVALISICAHKTKVMSLISPIVDCYKLLYKSMLLEFSLVHDNPTSPMMIYTYLIYSGILFFCLFKNIGYGGCFSFHKILEMLLLFRDENHAQQSSIDLDISQLVMNVILGRGKRGSNSLTFEKFDNLCISTL